MPLTRSRASILSALAAWCAMAAALLALGLGAPLLPCALGLALGQALLTTWPRPVLDTLGIVSLAYLTSTSIILAHRFL